MGLISKLWAAIKSWRQNLRAQVSKYLVTRQVTKVLSLTHAQELSITPRNEWALVRQRQIAEIQAVQSGQQFDIVDRRSWAYPYLPEALHRLNQPVLKNTPYNLRRFSETPIPRRAMNLVKNSVLGFKWQIKPTKDFVDDDDPDREKRIKIATETLKRPNNAGESFRDLLEQMVEDFLLNGAAVAEHRATPYAKRPTKFWAVDSCYSFDTEVLTKRGWLFWPDVNKDDIFATRNKHGYLEWQEAIRLSKHIYDGEMYHLTAQGKGLDFLVTPDHRMFGRKTKKVWLHKGDDTTEVETNQFVLAKDLVKVMTRVKDRSISSSGENNKFSVLTWKKVKLIRKYIKKGWSVKAISDKINVKYPTVYDVVIGKSWTVKPPKYTDPFHFQAPVHAKWTGLFPDNYKDGMVSIEVDEWEITKGKRGIKGWQKPVCIKVTHWVKLEDWVAFLGIYVAEGSSSGVMGNKRHDTSKKKTPLFIERLAASADYDYIKKGKHYNWGVSTTGKSYEVQPHCVIVSQTRKSKYYTEIENLLHRLPFQFTPLTKTGGGFTCRHKGFHALMFPLGNKYGKKVPQWIKDLPPKYIKIFVDWYMKGDGHKRSKDGVSSSPTASRKLADDLQELFMKLGRSASLSIRPEGLRKIHGKEYQCAPLYGIQERKIKWIGIRKVEKITYSDYVYCATVPNSTLYVRRNGYPAWCGNSTIRIFLDWTESTPDRPRYAQMTGLKGERGIVTFLSDELMYIRDNIRTATPFGLGRLEVAFNSVNAFLGVQDMSARAGADQVHKTWLWWQQTLNTAHVQQIRRHVQNELEGQAKLSLIAGVAKPDVVEVTPVTPEDLLIDWQKFLIQIIAAAFDLSPQALNMDDHPAKATAQVMADSDWKNAVVPVATRFQTSITRQWLHDDLGWKDIEFSFDNLDDPDLITRTIIDQRLYQMSAMTPNEIRAKNNMPPLPGPWGKLTMSQMQLITMSAQAQLTGKAQGGPGGSSGGGSSQGGMSSGSTGGTGSLGTGIGSNASMGFSADDVSMMDPQEIQLYQELGILPPTQQLGDQMEQQSPGILDQLSTELTTFFQNERQQKEEDEVLPDPVTKQDEAMQLEKFYTNQHQESLAEKVINRRGTFGPAVSEQVSKNPIRGKYPRSGSGFFEDKQGKDRVDDTPIKTGKVKKNYSKGKNNPYGQ